MRRNQVYYSCSKVSTDKTVICQGLDIERQVYILL